MSNGKGSVKKIPIEISPTIVTMKDVMEPQLTENGISDVEKEICYSIRI